ELRAYLDRLTHDRKVVAGFEAPYRKDAAAYARRAWKQHRLGSTWDLTNTTVVRLFRNGLARTYRQRVFQVLSEAGAKEQRVQEIRYTPDDQEVEVKAARIYKKNGEVVEAAGRSDKSLSEPWSRLYYDYGAE